MQLRMRFGVVANEWMEERTVHYSCHEGKPWYFGEAWTGNGLQRWDMEP